MTEETTSLHSNPLEIGNRLAENYGVLDYEFDEPLDPERAKTDLDEHIPSNLQAINDALARRRDDLPDTDSWRNYCQRAWNASIAQ